MKIDLREPTVVIAGAFNPAIFGVGWVASEMFGIADGEQVEATMVADMVQQTQRAYIGKVGVMAEPLRLSVFVDDLDEATTNLAEAAIIKAAEALPHTPVAAIGINFSFTVEEPDKDIVDILRSGDGLERIGPIIQSEINSRLQIEPTVQLNFSRSIVSDVLVMRFNYHTDLSRLSLIDQGFYGKIAHWRAHAIEVMNTIYGLGEAPEILRALNS